MSKKSEKSAKSSKSKTHIQNKKQKRSYSGLLKFVIVVFVIIFAFKVLDILDTLVNGYSAGNSSRNYYSERGQEPWYQRDSLKRSVKKFKGKTTDKLSLNGENIYKYDFVCNINYIGLASEVFLLGKDIDKNGNFNLSKAEIRDFYNQQDIDKSGGISKQEFKQFISLKTKPFTSLVFDSLDKNNDSMVTAKEIVSCLEY